MTTTLLDVWNENAFSVKKTVLRMVETQDFHLISISELRTMFTLFRTVMQADHNTINTIRRETNALCATLHPKLEDLLRRYMHNSATINDTISKDPKNYSHVIRQPTVNILHGMTRLFQGFPPFPIYLSISDYSNLVEPIWERIHEYLEEYLPSTKPRDSIIWKDLLDHHFSKDVLDAWVAQVQNVTSGVLLGLALNYACKSSKETGEGWEDNEKARFEKISDMLEKCKRMRKTVEFIQEEASEAKNTNVIQDILAEFSEKDTSIDEVVKKLQEQCPGLKLIVLRYKPLENHQGFTSKSLMVNCSKYYSANGSKYSYVAIRTDYLEITRDKDGNPTVFSTRQGDLNQVDNYQRDKDLDCIDVVEALKLVTKKPYFVFVLEYRPAYNQYPVPNRGDAGKLEFGCVGTANDLLSYKSMECFQEKKIKGFPSTYRFITTKHVVVSNTVL